MRSESQQKPKLMCRKCGHRLERDLSRKKIWYVCPRCLFKPKAGKTLGGVRYR